MNSTLRTSRSLNQRPRARLFAPVAPPAATLDELATVGKSTDFPSVESAATPAADGEEHGLPLPTPKVEHPFGDDEEHAGQSVTKKKTLNVHPVT